MGMPGPTDEERRGFAVEGDRATPPRRTGTVEEVAAAALFPAADATCTTKGEPAVDGGFAQGLTGAHRARPAPAPRPSGGLGG